MEFKDRKLIFDDSTIYFIDKDSQKKHFVMMDWEHNIMKAHADYACSNGGDILEIGFGMGISANYIQQNNIKSHTIVECHPEVINNAFAWAENKPNVNIILGDWFDVKYHLGLYDGLFYDTYGDTKAKQLKDYLPTFMKNKGVATWWNSYNEKNNQLGIKADSYSVINVNPKNNNYFKFNKYYLPKKEFK